MQDRRMMWGAVGFGFLVAVLAIGWWLSGESPSQEQVLQKPGPQKVAPAKIRPKVTVVRQRASEPTTEAVDVVLDSSRASIDYKTLSADEKKSLSVAQNIVGGAIIQGCLAGTATTVELELTTTQNGLHSVEIVYDGDLDESKMACLEDLSWRLPWPNLKAEGLLVQHSTLVVDPKVPARPLDELVAEAEIQFNLVLPQLTEGDGNSRGE